MKFTCIKLHTDANDTNKNVETMEVKMQEIYFTDIIYLR